MKTHIFGIFALSVFFIAGCSNEEEFVDGNSGKQKVITISTKINQDEATRVIYQKRSAGGLTVEWSEDDSFTLYRGKTSKGSKFNKIASSNDFTGFVPDDGEGDYYAVYYEDPIIAADGYCCINLENQSGVVGSDNGVAEFMVAKTDDLTKPLSFSHKLSVLNVNVSLPESVKADKVDRIIVNGLHTKAKYDLEKDQFVYSNDDRGDIAVTNNSKGFVVEDDNTVHITISIFPEQVNMNHISFVAEVGDEKYGEVAYDVRRTFVAGKVTSTSKVELCKVMRTYSSKDFYTWDNSSPFPTEINWGALDFTNYAKHSCKDAPTFVQLKMYLGNSTKFDYGEKSSSNDLAPRATFMINGRVSHRGVWFKKKKYIEGFDDGTAFQCDKTTMSRSESQRPKFYDQDKYFFLPEIGGYGSDKKWYPGSVSYWTAETNEKYYGKSSSSVFVLVTDGQYVRVASEDCYKHRPVFSETMY